MNIEKQKQKNTGFTLIEMVVVMGMIGIVSMATLKLVRFSDINKNLTLATAEVKGAIRTAQTLALAPPIIEESGVVRHICGFVVKNSTPNDNLIITTVFPKNNEVKFCRELSNINQICDGGTNTTCEEYETKHFDGFSVKEGTGDVKIFFRAPYGEVIGAGNVTITQNGGSGSSKTIEVNNQGKINVQ